LLDLDRLGNDLGDAMRGWSALEVGEEKAGKVGVETFVSRDELVLRDKTVNWKAPGARNETQRTENVKPGIKPRFLSQKIEAKEPEKKMPSTAANATSRSAKTARGSEIHRSAHSAFLVMQGTVASNHQYAD
jgi:hypothetical protein